MSRYRDLQRQVTKNTKINEIKITMCNFDIYLEQISFFLSAINYNDYTIAEEKTKMTTSKLSRIIISSP